MRHHRVARLILCLVTIVGLIAGICVSLWPQDRFLLKHATRILDMPDLSSYVWLSDHQILFFCDHGLRHDLFMLDTISGRRTRCPRLQALNLQGGEWQEVGIVEYPDSDLAVPLEQMSWAPGGHCISFVYHHVLYTVPVKDAIKKG